MTRGVLSEIQPPKVYREVSPTDTLQRLLADVRKIVPSPEEVRDADKLRLPILSTRELRQVSLLGRNSIELFRNTLLDELPPSHSEELDVEAVSISTLGSSSSRRLFLELETHDYLIERAFALRAVRNIVQGSVADRTFGRFNGEVVLGKTPGINADIYEALLVLLPIKVKLLPVTIETY